MDRRQFDHARRASRRLQLGGADRRVVAEPPECHAPACALGTRDAVNQRRRGRAQNDVDDPIVNVEWPLAHVVQETGGEERRGRLVPMLPRDPIGVPHGLDGVATVARAHRQEQVQLGSGEQPDDGARVLGIDGSAEPSEELTDPVSRAGEPLERSDHAKGVHLSRTSGPWRSRRTRPVRRR